MIDYERLLPRLSSRINKILLILRCNLLDDFRFRSHTLKEKMALGTEHPDPTGQPETDAYLDAMLEFLCRDASMNPSGLDGVFPST